MPTYKMPEEAGLTRYPLPALVVRYTARRRRRGEITDKTAQRVGLTLMSFAEVAPADIRKVNAGHVRKFIEDTNRAASTNRQYLSVVRTFMRWCITEGYIKRDPTIGIQGPAQPPSVPGALTVDSAEVLHRSIDRLEPRVRLMICLEKNEGLRRVEVWRAQIADIDRRGRAMKVRGKARGGRGDVTRNVPLSDETLSALNTYLSSEPGIIGVALASGPLFRNRNTPEKGIGLDRIGVLVTQALTDLGLKRGPRDGVSGHALRHTAATEALEAGVSRDVVQRFLGHQASASTDVYTRGAVFDLRQVHERRLERRDI